MRMGVYAILNVQNGMRYVGSSKYLEERMENHFHMLELGRHHNYKLQNAYDVCGDVWAWIILEECPVEELERCEQKWINRGNRYGRLYNIEMVADRKDV